jgi:hypothetical protein
MVTCNPKSRFPPVDSDVLLYLFLRGGKSFSPFKSNEEDVPYICYNQLLQSENLLNKCQSSDENSVQPGNNGNFLESSSSAIIIASSRQKFIEGKPFKSFMCYLMYHLSTSEGAIIPTEFNGIPTTFENLRIPNFLPPNQHSLLLSELQNGTNSGLAFAVIKR